MALQSPPDTEFIQSLARGIDVLRSFNRDRPKMTLSEAAKVNSLTRATCRRFLRTLVQLEYVGTDGKLFWLRPQVLDLGYRYLSSQPWWHAAQPIVEQTAAKVGETCGIAVLDGAEIVFLTGVSQSRITSIDIQTGVRLPAFATSTGRVLLGDLPKDEMEAIVADGTLQPLTEKTITKKSQLLQILQDVRKQDYCLVDREVDLGIRSLAVPIRNLSSGKAVAAINATCLVHHMKPAELLRKCLPVLQDAARKISQGIPK